MKTIEQVRRNMAFRLFYLANQQLNQDDDLNTPEDYQKAAEYSRMSEEAVTASLETLKGYAKKLMDDCSGESLGWLALCLERDGLI